jgi:tetratricopeptide (TPR) repeat protein
MSAKDAKEDLFLQADTLLFKDKKFSDAEKVYRKIIELDPKNIDAWNSVAYCVKFASSHLEPDKMFKKLTAIYETSLSFDAGDVEANFNVGLLYLQYKTDTSLALQYFQKCVGRDKDGGSNCEFFRSQFAKAYYNIGMIFD